MGRGKLTPKKDPADRRRIDELEETYQPRSMRRYSADPTVKVLRNTEIVVVDDGDATPYLAFRVDQKLIRVLTGTTINVTNITTEIIELPELLANRLVATDDDAVLVSVEDLTEWIAGTVNEITVTDDGDGTVTLALSTPAVPDHIIFTVWNPNAVEDDDSEVCIWKATPADLTISELAVTLNAADDEVVGDLKYADTFIGLANPVVINTFDTTSGELVDDSITVGAVPAGKCLYLSFDTAPAAAITQMNVDITFTYD